MVFGSGKSAAPNPAPKSEENPQSKPQEQPQAGTALAVIDYGADAGGGLDNISKDELTLPFLGVLQALSPELDPTSAKYIIDAKIGMIVNKATGELYTQLEMIPCHRDHNFVEYVPRNAGGGFVGIRATDDELVLMLRAKQGKFGSLKTNENTELSETYYLYGLFRADENSSWFRALIGFKSTQIKVYTGFMNIVATMKYPNADGKLIMPPIWAHRWQATTRPDANKKGKFTAWSLKPAEERVQGSTPYIKSRMRPDEAPYLAARDFYDMIKQGRVIVKHEEREAGQEPDDEIPM